MSKHYHIDAYFIDNGKKTPFTYHVFPCIKDLDKAMIVAEYWVDYQSSVYLATMTDDDTDVPTIDRDESYESRDYRACTKSGRCVGASVRDVDEPMPTDADYASNLAEKLGGRLIAENDKYIVLDDIDAETAKILIDLGIGTTLPPGPWDGPVH